jgi:hypothetical protein
MVWPLVMSALSEEQIGAVTMPGTIPIGNIAASGTASITEGKLGSYMQSAGAFF